MISLIFLHKNTAKSYMHSVKNSKHKIYHATYRCPPKWTVTIKVSSIIQTSDQLLCTFYSVAECLSQIPDPNFSIPNPGSKIYGIGSRIRIFIKELKYF